MFSVVTVLQKNLTILNVNFESVLARDIVQPSYSIALECMSGCVL